MINGRKNDGENYSSAGVGNKGSAAKYGVDIQLAVVVDYDMPEEKVKRIIYDEIAKYRATFKDMI